jgi:hypothetical protein
MANLIRLKQLDQADLSGFFNDAFVNTGLASKTYVDRFSDQTVSGIKTFANGVNLDGIDTLNLSGVDITITSGNVVLTNPLSAPNVLNIVYTSGNQIISGVKTFVNSGIFSLSGTSALSLPNNPLSIVGSGNTYVQVNIQNRATGATATADLVITANNGTDASNYIDLGINNSGYNDPNFSNGGAYDGYLFVNGGSLDIGTQTTGTNIEFHIGGTTAIRTIARITSDGLNIISGTLTASNVVYNIGNQTISGVKTFTSFPIVNDTGIVYQLGDQTISGVKTFASSGIFSLSGATPLVLPNNPLSVVGSGNTYLQINIQNRATGTTATSDLVLTANNGTDTTNYINLGINNSGYSDSAFSNGNQFDGYLFVQGGNLDIATTPVNSAIEFHAEGTTADKVIARIDRSGLSIITGNIYISGNPVLTGNTNLYGTTANLETTGSTLVNSINSLSGSSVLIYGNQNISGAKTFFDSGVFSLSGVLPLSLANNPLSIVGSGNSYLQLNIQNRATGNTASADLVITANNGTDSTNFINLGINNVGYNDPNFTNGTGLDGYLFIDGGDLDIGTRTPGRAIEFHAGGASAVNTIARISQSGINLISGTLNLSNSYLSGENIKPNTGIALYNRTANARQILTQVDPGGKSIAFQPSFVSNRVIFYQPRPNSVSFTNTNTNINLSANTFGVVAARPIYLQTNDILGHIPRIGFVHTGGLFEAGFTNNVEPTTFRGTGGLGGFFFQTRFAISENRIGTSGKGFWGLWDKQTIAATVSNPGGVINTPYGIDRQNIIGVGFNSGDSNLSFIHADGTSPGTDDATRKKISLGSNFPIRSGNVYEFSMYALPDQTYVDMNISILKSGIFTGYRATNALPAPDYALAPNFSINGPAATGNIAFDLCAFYLDTPY